MSTTTLYRKLKETLYFYWVIASGYFAITVTTTCYLITRGPVRGPEIYRRWNVRMAEILFFLTGIRVRVRYESDLKGLDPCIFVSNHQSVLDVPVSAIVVPFPFGFVAKKELEHIPFLGHAIRYSPSVFVDRSSPRRALESIRAAADEIRAGTSVIMFPEGGRSYSTRPGEFKRGAFLLAVEAGVPLVPVAILNASRVLNDDRRRGRPGTVCVSVGEPISVAGLDRKDIPELARKVELFITEELEKSDIEYQRAAASGTITNKAAGTDNDEHRHRNRSREPGFGAA